MRYTPSVYCFKDLKKHSGAYIDQDLGSLAKANPTEVID